MSNGICKLQITIEAMMRWNACKDSSEASWCTVGTGKKQGKNTQNVARLKVQSAKLRQLVQAGFLGNPMPFPGAGSMARRGLASPGWAWAGAAPAGVVG